MRRMQALARSQSALMDKGFQGAFVAEIIRMEFEGFSDRVVAAGPDVMLNSKATQAFSLLLHNWLPTQPSTVPSRCRTMVRLKLTGRSLVKLRKPDSNFNGRSAMDRQLPFQSAKVSAVCCSKNLLHRNLSRNQR